MFYISEKQISNRIVIIIFEDYLGNKKILKANENEPCFSLFQRYINETNKYNEYLKFIFNGKALNPYINLGQNGLRNYDVISVLKYGNILGGGGFSMNFTDLSKKITKQLPLSIAGPDYRRVDKGINIHGKCKYEKCRAYNDEVCIPLRGIQIFDLVKERGNLKCPACRSLIEPKTVSFFLCEYKVKGKKYVDGGIENFEFFGKAENPTAIEFYDPIKNGETIVIELTFEVINYF